MSARHQLRAIGFAFAFACGCTQAPGSPAGPDAWVDPQLGTDDLQHGGAPGAAAFRTITYALQHASGTINLDSGTYDAASGETFPLTLTGTQVLRGEADLSSHIVGNGPLAPTNPSDPLYTTIALTGTGNDVASCDVTTTRANPDWFPACVRITTSGPHVVEGSNLHGCFAAVDFSGQSGATVRDVTTGDVTLATAGNCLNQVGNDVHVANFSCRASNDWVFVCGTNFTGCGTAALGRVAACSVDVTAFAAACP